jgi:hypoxanthine-guanine phosphoribosyltransferase
MNERDEETLWREAARNGGFTFISDLSRHFNVEKRRGFVLAQRYGIVHRKGTLRLIREQYADNFKDMAKRPDVERYFE